MDVATELLEFPVIAPKEEGVTRLTVQRRLEVDKLRAESACLRARATHEALVASISELEEVLENRGGMDRDTVTSLEARRFQLLIQLERFDRDVALPAEEMRLLTISRMAAFTAEIELERKLTQRAARRPRLKRRIARGPAVLGRPRPGRRRTYRLMMTRSWLR